MKSTCLLFALLFAGVTVSAQQRDQSQWSAVGDDEGIVTAPRQALPATTFRAGVDLVALNVIVTDANQNFVNGLEQGNFAVFEDGIRQEVSFFAAGEVPLDLAILLDTSASMADRMSTAQQAAIGFVSTLRETDRLLVVDIKDTTRVLSPLGSDFDAARKAIRSTSARGGTGLFNGLYLTLKEMTKQRRANGEVRRQALVVLSDGDDTSSLVTFDDVMDLAKESGLSIYTITLRSRWSSQLTAATNGRRYFSQADFSMKSLAQQTGGRSFFPNEISELTGVYDQIADELASQYALGYSSKNPRRDGSYRRVIVQIRDHADVQARTRPGYLSARAQASVVR